MIDYFNQEAHEQALVNRAKSAEAVHEFFYGDNTPPPKAPKVIEKPRTPLDDLLEQGPQGRVKYNEADKSFDDSHLPKFETPENPTDKDSKLLGSLTVAEAKHLNTRAMQFDEYGVNAYYNTRYQEAEHLRMQNKQLLEYTKKRIILEFQQKDLKNKFKELDRTFKDEGFDVALAKRSFKSFVKQMTTPEEELQTQEIIFEWLKGDFEVIQMIRDLRDYDDNAKVAWKEGADQRAQNRMNKIAQHLQERREMEEEVGFQWMDAEHERLSKLVSLKVPNAYEQLEEVKEKIRIRDERRAQGLPMLPEHDEPLYPDQWLARKDEFIKPKEEKILELPNFPERFQEVAKATMGLYWKMYPGEYLTQWSDGRLQQEYNVLHYMINQLLTRDPMIKEKYQLVKDEQKRRLTFAETVFAGGDGAMGAERYTNGEDAHLSIEYGRDTEYMNAEWNKASGYRQEIIHQLGKRLGGGYDEAHKFRQDEMMKIATPKEQEQLKALWEELYAPEKPLGDTSGMRWAKLTSQIFYRHLVRNGWAPTNNEKAKEEFLKDTREFEPYKDLDKWSFNLLTDEQYHKQFLPETPIEDIDALMEENEAHKKEMIKWHDENETNDEHAGYVLLDFQKPYREIYEHECKHLFADKDNLAKLEAQEAQEAQDWINEILN